MATALQIAQNIPGGGDWAAKDEEVRNLSLIQATRWLETIDYDGTRCKASQRLKWPRSGATCDGVTSDCSGIPYQIQEAEVMLAIQYDQNPGSFPGTDSGGTTQTGTYVAEQTLGDLSINTALIQLVRQTPTLQQLQRSNHHSEVSLVGKLASLLDEWRQW